MTFQFGGTVEGRDQTVHGGVGFGAEHGRFEDGKRSPRRYVSAPRHSLLPTAGVTS